MCGFAGFLLGSPQATKDSLESRVRRMSDRLRHRGPDDSGTWTDPAVGLALGHRRLSIVDLSPSGHQPMTSHDGRWVITFNGEIYNFERIRRSLEAQFPHRWAGHSDTEVLLAAISCWGVEGALKHAIGMFSFALWDTNERRLYLGRDRAGEKPLYYGRCGDALMFASELKAFTANPGFNAGVSATALASYMRHAYVPGPLSIFEGIHKLPPGHLAIVEWGSLDPKLSRYWSSPQRQIDPILSEREHALSELDILLRDAVGLQMQADVPMGAFLSGGVDSSLIAALMQAQSPRPIKTFAIGFENAGFDEAPHAAAVAGHLGTEHRSLVATAADALKVVPDLPEIYDEPFADSSQIPTILLARMTREHVTVSLSGDAGDEIFGGYTRYSQARQFQRLYSRTPRWARRLSASGLRRAPAAFWSGLRAVAPPRYAELVTEGRIAKALFALESDNLIEVYHRLISQWQEPLAIVDAQQEAAGVIDDVGLRAAVTDPVDWMMAADFKSYLPDDILVKVDRATMAVSLEARVPFLDHRVIEFAARLPSESLVRDGQGKLILRDLLYNYVPRSLIERPKQGFAVPLAEWLRGSLRDWAESLLDPAWLTNGMLRPEPIRRLWEAHLSGRDCSARLWTVLMYSAWLRRC